jgi:hypothetical protein
MRRDQEWLPIAPWMAALVVSWSIVGNPRDDRLRLRDCGGRVIARASMARRGAAGDLGLCVTAAVLSGVRWDSFR